MKLSLDHLPATARELIDVMGLPATLRFIEAYRGQTLAIAKGKRLRGTAHLQEIAEKIGAVAAKALCRRYGGSYLSVPMCTAALRAMRDARLQARFDEITGGGNSARHAVSVLVREFTLDGSTVWRVLKRPSGDAALEAKAADDRQPALF
ncbi:MAG: Mor transcription activator family protein [Sterolibacterium sp.]|nr:Mor transcription activator family protein [Sterolibacterium sp.]